jgi:hypothetical protein
MRPQRSLPLLLLVLISTPTLATDRYYVGPDNGLWSDPNNWSLTDGGPGGAGAPVGDSGANAIVSANTSKTVILDVPYSTTSGRDKIFASIGATMTLSQSSATWDLYYESILAGGRHVQTGGRNESNDLHMEGEPTRPASYYLSGTGQIEVLRSYIENSYFQQSGGRFFSLASGPILAGNTIYDLNAGSCGGEAIEVGAGATFNQNGGTAGTVSALSVDGTYNLFDGSASNREAFIGLFGTGVFNQTGGTNTVPSGTQSTFFLGYGSSTTGTYNLSAGQLTADRFYVGWAGTGTFNQTGGNATIASLTIRQAPGSRGAALISGGSLSVGSLGNNDTLAIYPHTNILVTSFGQAAAGKLLFELDDPDNADYPHIQGRSQINAYAILNGNLTVTLTNDYAPTLGDTFTLITSPSLTGTFSSYTLPPLADGLSWLPTYTPTSFSLSVAVPEPAISLLLLPLLTPRRQRRVLP